MYISKIRKSEAKGGVKNIAAYRRRKAKKKMAASKSAAASWYESVKAKNNGESEKA